MRRPILWGVIAVVVAATLGFTQPGRAVLAEFGLAKACSSSDCN